MAAAVVFVDDAVLGRLPRVCIVDGVPTDGRAVVSRTVGATGFGIAWLLILAGPPGWLGLLIFGALRNHGERLTVVLPLSEAARARSRQAQIRLREALVAAGGGALGGLLLLRLAAEFTARTQTGLALGSRIGALGLGLAACWGLVEAVRQFHRLAAVRVGVALDASHRWVTLTGVHPRFAAEVHAQAPSR